MATTAKCVKTHGKRLKQHIYFTYCDFWIKRNACIKYKRFSVLIFLTRSVYAPDLTSKSTQLFCNNTNNNKNSSGVHGLDTKAYRDSIYRVTSRSGCFLLCFRCFLLDSVRFLDFKGSVVLQQQRWAASPPTAARRVP